MQNLMCLRKYLFLRLGYRAGLIFTAQANVDDDADKVNDNEKDENVTDCGERMILHE